MRSTARCVGIVVAILGIATPAANAFDAEKGLIAYAAGGGEDNYVIRTVRLDGTGDRRLIGARRGLFLRGPSGPRWSADGRKLLFGGHHHLDGPVRSLWYSTASGRRITRIPLGLGPVRLAGWDWAPDGRRVVFAAGKLPRGKTRIYTIAIDGTHRRTLARGDQPDWSGDGRRIAFQRSEESTGDPARYGVFVMRRNGSGLTRLTAGADDRGPSISPDGREVAFLRAFFGPGPNPREEWHTIDIGGQHDVLVATHPTAAGPFYCPPQWTPDGARLAAVRTVPAPTEEGRRAQLVSLSPDGSDERVHLGFRQPDVNPFSRCDLAWRP